MHSGTAMQCVPDAFDDAKLALPGIRKNLVHDCISAEHSASGSTPERNGYIANENYG
jgi:hypothetical protein